MIARTYALIAADGQHDELLAALIALAARVRALPGSERVEVLRDQKNSANFLFVETWRTSDAAADGGKALGREAFAPIMASLAVPPASAQHDVV